METDEHTITHPWDISVADAIAIQQRLRPLVLQAASVALDEIHTVAGIDASYTHIGRAAVVVFSFPDLMVMEQIVAVRESVFPYVPGLLAFREGPVVLDAMARLKTTPDLLMFDGQGYAHPRRFGLASHLGLYLDRPSIGCAKSRLIGKYREPGPNIGDRSPLTDAGETIGMVVRSKPRTRPLFVSQGYKLDLLTAVEMVLRCLRGYRLPEPTRAADRLAGSAPAVSCGSPQSDSPD
jgi:deoxyribonuclease V